MLDRGTISAGDRHTSISEIEMELYVGRPQALFDLARKLGGTAPVRLGVLTKPERGHRLTQALEVVIEAGPVPLHKEMTAADAFQLIVLVCIKQFRLNEDLLLASRSPEPLHQARVALRRLRSAFSIFKPLLGDVAARELSDGSRELAGELGPAVSLMCCCNAQNRGVCATAFRPSVKRHMTGSENSLVQARHEL